MSLRIIPAAIAIVFSLLLTALVPTGAAAHAGHLHPAPKAAAVNDVATPQRIQAELKSWAFVPGEAVTDRACEERGCCSNGHCSGCCTVLAPSSSAEFGRLSGVSLPLENFAPPSGLAREGPPRPPKSIA
jgi:hypothetical protein